MTKLNDALLEQLLEELKEVDRTTACQSVGIDRMTLYRWCEEGKKDLHAGRDTEKAHLYVQVNKARADFKRPVVESMRSEGSRGNVQAGKMVLQAEDRKTWGDSIQVQEETKEVMRRIKSVLSPEDYEKVLTAIEE